MTTSSWRSARLAASAAAALSVGAPAAHAADAIATAAPAAQLPSLRAGAEFDFPDRESAAKATSLAAFAQFTWTPPILDDRLRLTGGVRYTEDDKNGELRKVNGLPDGSKFKFADDRIDPAVAADFAVTSDILRQVRLIDRPAPHQLRVVVVPADGHRQFLDVGPPVARRLRRSRHALQLRTPAHESPGRVSDA